MLVTEHIILQWGHPKSLRSDVHQTGYPGPGPGVDRIAGGVPAAGAEEPKEDTIVVAVVEVEAVAAAAAAAVDRTLAIGVGG